ncbi:MAG: MATE family efflux transporter [Bacteroidia bacterium]
MKRVLRVIRLSLNGEDVDYTNIPIRSAVFLLAIPMILELSLESVFAVVDMYFVGSLGSNAIATVGLTESFICIIY